MCRLVAYIGPEIPLERIVVLPEHSLLDQSQNATEAKLAVNGDGFGVSWYSDQDRPGLYRDILPAWSDGNLTNLCRMVKSRLFLAHVRASTTGETSRVNCHPFTYDRWSFMHNGQIAGFSGVRRHLEGMLPDEFYFARRGTTDSELLFLLMLANGLDDDPFSATRKTIGQITKAQKQSAQPNRITCAFSDGARIFGFRHSCDGKSPSLYVGRGLDSGGAALASEPLDNSVERWEAVREATFIELDDCRHAEARCLS